MNKEINKIISWIEMSYTRLNYKEELLLVNYIKQLQQENKKQKEHIEKYERYCKTTGIKELMENQKYKEVIDKAIEYINDNLIISSILDGKKYYTINDYSFDYKELLNILKEVE